MSMRGTFAIVTLALGALLASGSAAHAEVAGSGFEHAGLLSNHGRLEVRAHHPLKLTPALRAATQRDDRRHGRHRLHRHRYAAARHELTRSAANGIPAAPAPTHSHSLPARVPVAHQLRGHDGGPRSSPRHAAATAWVDPTVYQPMGIAMYEASLPVDRVELWRITSRGPPAAALDGALLPSEFAQRPLAAFPGARLHTFLPCSTRHETLAFGPGSASSVADLTARSATASRERAVSATRLKFSNVPQPCSLEARYELHCAPAEGPAADVPVPSCSGGSS